MIVTVLGLTVPAHRKDDRVANDEPQHVALPKLFGAPAYARPPAEPVVRADRPFDPDALPIEAAQTEEERLLVAQLTHHAGGPADPAEAGTIARTSRPAGAPSFRLPSITGLLRGAGTLTSVDGGGSMTGSGSGADRAGGPVDPAAEAGVIGARDPVPGSSSEADEPDRE
jgi:hypothetical protein